MLSPSERVLEALRWFPDEWLSAVDVARRLGMNTAAGGERYIKAVSETLLEAVISGRAMMRLPLSGEDFTCRYKLMEAA